MRSRWASEPDIGNCSPEAVANSSLLTSNFSLNYGVGWRGLPLRTIKGADTGFRRTADFHPRRAQRKDQVCGDFTVRSDGQGKKKVQRPGWHLIHRKRSPFPSIGEGLKALEWKRDSQCRAINKDCRDFLTAAFVIGVRLLLTCCPAGRRERPSARGGGCGLRGRRGTAGRPGLRR